MKKIILFITIILLLVGCTKESTKARISKTLDINLDKCDLLYEKDTHSGFLGDGDFFARIKCSEGVYFSDNWKKLPLSKTLEEVMNMKQCDDKCVSVFEKYNIPDISDGYYLFLDRHSDSTNKYDDTNINNRSSYNFSIAIYDINKNIMYYYEMDT